MIDIGARNVVISIIDFIDSGVLNLSHGICIVVVGFSLRR